MPDGPPPAPRLHESVPLEDRRYGASSRPARLLVACREHVHDLLRAPVGVFASELRDGRLDIPGGLIRVPMRPPELILEPRNALRLESLDPLVERLAAHAVPLGQKAHRKQPASVVHQALHPLGHGCRLLPGHRAFLLPPELCPVSPMSLDCSVTHVPGLNRMPANNALQRTRNGRAHR